MDILMRAGEEITGDLFDWTDDKEKAFWRGHKPRQAVDRVYFVRDGFIIGWARFSRCGFVETKTVQGDLQSGDAFVIKGPLTVLKRRVPEDFTKGRWPWRYVEDDMKKELKL